MKRIIRVSLFSIFFLLTFRMFCGVYIHDEYGEMRFFIKHRPTWKWEFYSPIGQSDLTIEELTLEKQIEQNYFNEFIRDQKLSR